MTTDDLNEALGKIYKCDGMDGCAYRDGRIAEIGREVEYLQDQINGLNSLLRSALFHVESEGDCTLASMIRTQLAQ